MTTTSPATRERDRCVSSSIAPRQIRPSHRRPAGVRFCRLRSLSSQAIAGTLEHLSIVDIFFRNSILHTFHRVCKPLAFRLRPLGNFLCYHLGCSLSVESPAAFCLQHGPSMGVQVSETPWLAASGVVCTCQGRVGRGVSAEPLRGSRGVGLVPGGGCSPRSGATRVAGRLAFGGRGRSGASVFRLRMCPVPQWNRGGGGVQLP